ncbi:MAG: anion permease [Pyramidobacter sp.]|nr:anion permease [Pyramidobacter sp.]
MMNSSTIAIIILVITIISFIAEKIPLAMTAMISSIAMGLLIPEMSIKAIYTGFGTSTVMLAVGMGIVGEALFRTGMAEKLGQSIVKSAIAKNERVFVTVIVAVTGLMSAFLSNVGTIAMFIPLIGVAAAQSKGLIRNKMVVMAAGMGTAVGGAGTLVGSTAQQIANNALMATKGYENGLTLFSMSAVGAICYGITVLYFATIGYSIMKRVFKDDLQAAAMPAAETAQESVHKGVPAWKGRFALFVLLFCIVGFVLTSFKPFSKYLDIGIVALIGATVLISTGCISIRDALHEGVDWNTVTILGACTGFAKGLDVSGGGKVIATAVLNLFGGASASPAVLMIAGIIVAIVLTNFMTNTSLAAMITPIYIHIALQLNVSPVPFVIVIGCIATNLATATPVGTTAVTMTLPAGYKYMDYVKVGGLLNIILLIVACLFCPGYYL